MQYTVILLVDPDDGGDTALIPTLPGCISEGDTLDETLAMIQDAAAGHLVAAADRGEESPAEAFGTVVAEIDVPTPTTATVA